MTDTIQSYTGTPVSEIPTTVLVSYYGWETFSDAALRDDLNRIQEAGFAGIRVSFDRNNDIEKASGMLNWRNPDRLLDSAQRAGLKVVAGPCLEPHKSVTGTQNQLPWNEAERESVTAWLRRFCRQYRQHPALLAWELNFDHPWLTLLSNDDNRKLEEFIHTLIETMMASGATHPIVVTQQYTASPLSSQTESLRIGRTTGSFQNLIAGVHFSLAPADKESATISPDYLLAHHYLVAVGGKFTQSRPIMAILPGGNIQQMPQDLTFTPTMMRRALLLALGTGIRLICLDTWRGARTPLPRLGAGNSSLLDWLDRLTISGEEASQISKIVNGYGAQLSVANSKPEIQVVTQVTTEPFNHPQFVDLVYENQLAREGTAQALLNGNVSFGYINEQALMGSLNSEGAEYIAPTLFLPYAYALSDTLLKRLKELAMRGTRIVADMPCGWMDGDGALLDTRPGSDFEQLFGVSVAGIHVFDTPNVKDASPQRRGVIVTRTAKAVGGEGEIPAYTENRVGKGRVLLINLSLSRICANRNLHNAQMSLLSYLFGTRQTELPALAGCLVMRRSTPDGEHIFLINQSGEPRSTSVTVAPVTTQVWETLTGSSIPIADNCVETTLPPHSGTWLFCCI